MIEKSRLFNMILISVCICVLLYLYADFKSPARQKYLNTLHEVYEFYNVSDNSKRFENDLDSLGYMEVYRNHYERSYDRYRCEVISFNDEGVYYRITDTCYSVIDQNYIKDFDKDGILLLYSVDSFSNDAVYYMHDNKNFTLITHDFSKENSTVISEMIKMKYENSIERFNYKFHQFMNRINAIKK